MRLGIACLKLQSRPRSLDSSHPRTYRCRTLGNRKAITTRVKPPSTSCRHAATSKLRKVYGVHTEAAATLPLSSRQAQLAAPLLTVFSRLGTRSFFLFATDWQVLRVATNPSRTRRESIAGYRRLSPLTKEVVRDLVSDNSVEGAKGTLPYWCPYKAGNPISVPLKSVAQQPTGAIIRP